MPYRSPGNIHSTESSLRAHGKCRSFGAREGKNMIRRPCKQEGQKEPGNLLPLRDKDRQQRLEIQERLPSIRTGLVRGLAVLPLGVLDRHLLALKCCLGLVGLERPAHTPRGDVGELKVAVDVSQVVFG